MECADENSSALAVADDSVAEEEEEETAPFEAGSDEEGDQQTTHWRNLSVPSERIQFQITLEEGESGNEDD